MKSIRFCSSLLCLLGCGRFSGPEITIKIREGSRYCAVATVPKDWSVPELDALTFHGTYAKPVEGSDILYTLEDGTTVDQVIKEKYWISFTHPGQIRVATDADWSKATPIGHQVGSPKEMVWNGPWPEAAMVTNDDRVLQFRGHSYRKTEPIWSGAYPPPGDRFISLQSFNGFSAMGKAAFSGRYAIDVFDTQTARRLAQLSGTWSNYTPEGVLGELRWLSDADLVLPFGMGKRSILVCHF